MFATSHLDPSLTKISSGSISMPRAVYSPRTIASRTLTRRCKVNRQTFYYHFHDIYDLLALVFLNEKIPGIENVRNSEEMATSIFEYYLKNQRFIDETLNSAGKDLFVEFIYNTCYRCFTMFINNIADSKKSAY